jgi:hypothetical protein
MPDIIKQFDEVQLSDGRKGAVVEVLGDQDVFEVDVGSSPADWDTVTVKRKQIEKVIREAE